MEWKDAELADVMRCGSNAAPTGIYIPALPSSTLKAMMTRAVELAAARGGTMKAVRQIEDALEALPPEPGGRRAQAAWSLWDLRCCLTTLEGLNKAAGAKIAKLTQEVEDLESGRDNLHRVIKGLEAERDEIRAMHSQMCEVSMAHQRRAEQAEERVRQLALAGQHLSAAVDKHVGEPNPPGIPESSPPARYPCSPTCTHEDAALPGHGGVITSAESLANGYVLANDTATLFGARREAPVHSNDIARREGFNEGAEAMRAACWEAVQTWAQGRGLTREEMQSLKAVIEGAAP